MVCNTRTKGKSGDGKNLLLISTLHGVASWLEDATGSIHKVISLEKQLILLTLRREGGYMVSWRRKAAPGYAGW